MFQESQNRILSMALIHEKLYRSQDLSRIDLAGYIRSLATDLMHSYRSHSGPVALKINAKDVFLSIDQAVPCGLIINELISNSLKHAFPSHTHLSAQNRNGNKNEIHIDLTTTNENQVTLIVGDNGVGFPEDLDIQSLDSLGLRLINTLVGQLEGTLEMKNSDGTQFKLAFAGS
jgi:two-component sensor histidine kinase